MLGDKGALIGQRELELALLGSAPRQRIAAQLDEQDRGRRSGVCGTGFIATEVAPQRAAEPDYIKEGQRAMNPSDKPTKWRSPVKRIAELSPK